ncbi:MAG: phosphoribosylamine--glycine ligase, partial [Oscillospiraceae bacterium]|nr:phosphoribosylamine--glycine ligase [Oscillospiraceae bacterium]
MNICVVGSGGREHALCFALSKSPKCSKLFAVPGNAGMSELGVCFPTVKATDIDAVIAICVENSVDYCVVASDDPLAAGLVDALTENGIAAFGPTKAAAYIEASKAFSKGLMKKYGIPTARYETFTEGEAAKLYVHTQKLPIVVKADGLALGKGVAVAQSYAEAEEFIDELTSGAKFGSAGATIVIEEFMSGREATILAFTDGKTVSLMPASRDHKRAYDGDKGPNTGGMGAISPVPDVTPELLSEIERTITYPTIDALNKEGRTFKGVIYFELMLTPEGAKVIEYNARFGDPECQTLLPLLESDLLEVMLAVTEERLSELTIKWKNACSCCVVAASGGYPGDYAKGFAITGIADINASNVSVYHAGTALSS